MKIAIACLVLVSSACFGKELSSSRSSLEGVLKTKPLVVIFVSAKCPNSIAHLATVSAIAKKHTQFDFVGVHANADENSIESDNFFRKAKLPFPVMEDRDGVWLKDFAAFKTPHVFVVGQDQQILYRGGITNGASPESATEMFLENALTNVENGRPVEVPEGRTLGCIISREKKNVWK